MEAADAMPGHDRTAVETAARLASALERMTMALETFRNGGGYDPALEAAGQEYAARQLAAELGPELLEAIPDAVVVAAADGVIVLCNGAAERLTGYPRTELRGRDVEILLPEDLRDVHAAVHRPGWMADMQVRPMGAGLHLHLLHKYGTVIPVDISLGPCVTERGTYVFLVIRRRT